MIRKKQLFIALVIPYIFMLRKYFAVARTRFLVHVYAVGKVRGFFKFYTYSQKMWLYNYGYKTWLYNPKLLPAFEGKFKGWAGKFLDDDKIQEKKDAAIRSLTDEQEVIKLTNNQIRCLQDFAEIKILVDQRQNFAAYKTLNRLQNRIKDYEV